MKDDEEQITFCAGLTLVELQAKGDWTKFIDHYGYLQRKNKLDSLDRTSLPPWLSTKE